MLLFNTSLNLCVLVLVLSQRRRLKKLEQVESAKLRDFVNEGVDIKQAMSDLEAERRHAAQATKRHRKLDGLNAVNSVTKIICGCIDCVLRCSSADMASQVCGQVTGLVPVCCTAACSCSSPVDR